MTDVQPVFQNMIKAVFSISAHPITFSLRDTSFNYKIEFFSNKNFHGNEIANLKLEQKKKNKMKFEEQERSFLL